MIYLNYPLDSREKLEKRYKELIPVYKNILKSVVKSLQTSIDEKQIYVTIRSRIKDFTSWYAKLLRYASSEPNESDNISITDVLGIRIVCPFLEEVQIVSEMLQELFHVLEKEIKGADYPFHRFGYESVHFLVHIPDRHLFSKHLSNDFKAAPVCEVQVRTILQEAWAEVEHELIYKSDFSPLDEPLKRKLAALNANLTLSDIMFQEIRDYQKNFQSALRQRRKEFYKCIRQENEDSQKVFTPVIKSDGEDRSNSQETVDSLLLQGLLAHNNNRFSDAINIYTRILIKDIRDDIKAVILVHRGMAYFSFGHTNEALEDFHKALDINPDYTKARYYCAVNARIDGNFRKAFNDLEKCLTLEPYNPEYLTARAETNIAAGNSAAARADCKTVLSIDPDFKAAQRLLQSLNLE